MEVSSEAKQAADELLQGGWPKETYADVAGIVQQAIDTAAAKARYLDLLSALRAYPYLEFLHFHPNRNFKGKRGRSNNKIKRR